MKTILLVDDDPEVLSIIARIVSDNGYNGISANSLEEALEVVDRLTSLDMAIIDFWLDAASAIPVMEKLNDRFPEAPVVMITGGGHNLSVETSRAISRLSGATVFLQKPFRREALSSLLQKSLS